MKSQWGEVSFFSNIKAWKPAPLLRMNYCFFCGGVFMVAHEIRHTTNINQKQISKKSSRSSRQFKTRTFR